jgi:hypothetical protein
MAEPPAAQPAATPQPAVRRVAVIFNPATSPDDAPERKHDLQAALDAAGIEVVWLETTEQEAAKASPARPSSRAWTWSWLRAATAP